jgi:ribose transport system ATP-binding protein
LGVPAGLLAVVAIVVGLELVLFRTTAGRTLRAVGSSAAASQRLGINTRAVTVVAFVVSGTLAAAGGILLAGQIGMGSAGIGLDYSIMSITAVVIGGASIAGGRGSVIGTLVGAALVQIATSVSSFLNSDSSVHYAVLGSVTLLAAAIFSVAARRQKSDGRDM